MFKSMTAYGRAVHLSPMGRFVAELQSVNRKHLEINTFLPPALIRFDSEIKRWISEEVKRGQVNVKISVSFDQFSPLRVLPNLPLIQQYYQAWKVLLADLKMSASQEAFLQMLSDKEVYTYEQEELDEEQCRAILQALISDATAQLKGMKEKEGRLLHDDISARFERLPHFIKEISMKASGATLRLRQRLMSRISELMGASAENEERILREISVYAEKIDIEEELTRLDSHLKQARELMSSCVEGVGKILEFLVQELNREINTIGSKSSDIDISRNVVEFKSELERIREQIQNIE